MAIVQENVTIDGVELRRFRSDQDVKIRCVEDGNMYPLAYLTQDATVTFAETSYPLNDITAGAIVSCDNVIGLSALVQRELSASRLTEGPQNTHLKADHPGVGPQIRVSITPTAQTLKCRRGFVYNPTYAQLRRTQI